MSSETGRSVDLRLRRPRNRLLPKVIDKFCQLSLNNAAIVFN